MLRCPFLNALDMPYVTSRPPVASSGSGLPSAWAAVAVRYVPANRRAAATSFVPTRWRGYLDTSRGQGRGAGYRHYWELSVLYGVQARLRSGDVWVPGSRRYTDPTTLLIPVEQWTTQRDDFCAVTGTDTDPQGQLQRLEAELHAAVNDLEQVLADPNTQGLARLDEDGELIVSPLPAEQVPAASDALAQAVASATAAQRSTDSGEPRKDQAYRAAPTFSPPMDSRSTTPARATTGPPAHRSASLCNDTGYPSSKTTTPPGSTRSSTASATASPPNEPGWHEKHPRQCHSSIVNWDALVGGSSPWASAHSPVW